MKRTLNIGCGERVYKEYPDGYTCINFDERNLPNVDDIGDARSLPYTSESFDYILASDIIEHFPIAETKIILKEWKRVLKINGVIEFRMPNLYSICKQYIDGKTDAKMTSYHLFGGQQYSGNFHYVCFDRMWFKSIIEPYGFVEIEWRGGMDSNNLMIKFRKE